MNFSLNKWVIIGAIVFIALILGLVFGLPKSSDHESATTMPEMTLADVMMAQQQMQGVTTQAQVVDDSQHHMVHEGFEGEVPSPAENGQESVNKPLEADNTLGMNQLPSECYPKDVLSSSDLLPDGANTQYATIVPNGQGALTDQNFLTAGYHIGINTVGQTLRNANRQLRSEPPNPALKVSPWNQTTIEADTNRRPLEIGGGGL